MPHLWLAHHLVSKAGNTGRLQLILELLESSEPEVQQRDRLRRIAPLLTISPADREASNFAARLSAALAL